VYTPHWRRNLVAVVSPTRARVVTVMDASIVRVAVVEERDSVIHAEHAVVTEDVRAAVALEDAEPAAAQDGLIPSNWAECHYL
jgi:hypothetical protein